MHNFDSQIKFDFGRTSQIGFGTDGDSLTGTVDLRRSGENNISPWVFLPEMSTTVRDTKTLATGQSSSGIGTGAVIFNKSTQKVQIYLPDGGTSASVNDWVGIATGANRSFRNISVSGFPVVDASTPEDTVIFAAGSNMTITSNPATKTVTFASSGGGGGGGGISLSSGINNRVITAIGVSAVQGEANLTFDGSTLGVTGSQTVSGSVSVGSSVTASAFYGDGSNLTGLISGEVSSGTFTASAGSPSTLNTYAYNSAELVFEYTIFVKNGSDYQSQKLLVMRDGTTVTSTQYAIMYSNNLIAQFDATISGSNLLLRATPETGVSGSTSYRIKREVT